MRPDERRASFSLAGIFALRMLGLFLILPVFALHAKTLPGGDNAARVGLALGIYGLVQACLHIPLGILSDRIGRKPVIVGGLLVFVAGSAVAALAPTLEWVIAGRAIQGAGAISAAITALLADLTRDSQRTKAMAMVGGSIGVSFALSLVIAAPLYESIGMAGMFWLMGLLGIGAIVVVLFAVPMPPAPTRGALNFAAVLLRPELLRLNIGVLVLHACQTAMFVVVPAMLVQAGRPLATHWQIYLPVVLVSFALMLGPMLAAERAGRIRAVVLFAIALLLAVEIGFGLLAQTGGASLLAIAALLLLFFTGFNILEAMQPSLVSRFAAEARGAALGIYNTTQALGLFIGGAAGGTLLKLSGGATVFYSAAALLVCWLAAAWTMRNPPRRDKAAAAH